MCGGSCLPYFVFVSVYLSRVSCVFFLIYSCCYHCLSSKQAMVGFFCFCFPVRCFEMISYFVSLCLITACPQKKKICNCVLDMPLGSIGYCFLIPSLILPQSRWTKLFFCCSGSLHHLTADIVMEEPFLFSFSSLSYFDYSTSSIPQIYCLIQLCMKQFLPKE